MGSIPGVGSVGLCMILNIMGMVYLCEMIIQSFSRIRHAADNPSSIHPIKHCLTSNSKWQLKPCHFFQSIHLAVGLRLVCLLSCQALSSFPSDPIQRLFNLEIKKPPRTMYNMATTWTLVVGYNGIKCSHLLVSSDTQKSEASCWAMRMLEPRCQPHSLFNFKMS